MADQQSYEGSDKVVLGASRVVAVFADATLFASSDATRPTLNTVRFEVAGGRGQTVSTDSYALGTFTFDAEGSMRPILVTLDDVKRIIGLAKTELKGGRSYAAILELVFEREGQTLSVRGPSGSSVTCRLVEADYPNYGQLFQAGERDHELGGYVGHGPSFYTRLGKVRMGQKECPVISLEVRGPLKPTHLYASVDGIVFRGLAMPVRTSVEREVMDSGPEVLSAK